ncbi:MAG: double zinc ribbon domain-containing protein [Chloroflexota bacterium]
MLDRLREILGMRRLPRTDLACPACGTANADYADRCKQCGKTLDNYWRRETAQFTRDYDTGFINSVFIMRRADSCPECQKLQNLNYMPWELPRLPHEACTHPEGCRCTYMPVMRMSFGFPGFGVVQRQKDRKKRELAAQVREEEARQMRDLRQGPRD